MSGLLCIGASGQLARSLAALGGNIKVAGRPDADLIAPDSLRELIDREQPDAVINTAAYTAVDQAETDQERARAVNVEGAERLASICQGRTLPLIHISTDYVFDGNDAPYSETAEPCPINVYGKTKFEGEQAVQDAHDTAIIIRTAWVHSPYGQSFTRTMAKLLAERDDVSVVDDQFGSPTYAPHLAQALVALTVTLANEPGLTTGRIYHLAGAGHASRLDWVREIADALRTSGIEPARIHPVSSDAFPTPATRPKDTRLDCRRIEGAFGLVLLDWREGVRACVNALLQTREDQA